jgi:acetyl esterase/lipase
MLWRLLIAACLLVIAGPLTAEEPGTGDYSGSTGETYKTIGDVQLSIYRFAPTDHQPTDRRPAIVFFFGGGWKNGQPTQFVQQCKYLAERGMVAFTADYRVSSRQGTKAKECVQDGKSAIRWVRTNAERLGVDPNRIAAGGGSAGGHVAACTGIIEAWDEPGESTAVSSVPNAMVLFNPALALAKFEGYDPKGEERTKDLPERMGTDPINLSPAHHVRPALPPTIMFFGTEDFLRPGAEFFFQEMKKAGNRCEFRLYDDQVHGFFNYGKNGNVYFRQTLTDADKFLTSLGYLDGEPRVIEWLSEQPAAERPNRRTR